LNRGKLLHEPIETFLSFLGRHIRSPATSRRSCSPGAVSFMVLLSIDAVVFPKNSKNRRFRRISARMLGLIVLVGWVERQRNPSLFHDASTGFASLYPSYAYYGLWFCNCAA